MIGDGIKHAVALPRSSQPIHTQKHTHSTTHFIRLSFMLSIFIIACTEKLFAHCFAHIVDILK